MLIKQKKKRRTPLSCIKCRQKKIKCDRAKPSCSRCINSKIECVYDSPIMWSEINETTFNIKNKNHNSVSFVSALGVNNYENYNRFNNNKKINTKFTNKELINNSVSHLSVDLPTTTNSITATPNINLTKYISEVSMDQDMENFQKKIDINDIPIPCKLEQKLSEIEYLKKRIKDIEKQISNSMETISLVLDFDDKPLTIFRSKKDSRFMCLGTLINSGVWRRDPLLNSFFKLFFSIKKHKKLKNDFRKDKKSKFSIIQKYYQQSTPNCCFKSNITPPIKLFEFLNAQLITKKKKIKMVDNEYFIQQIEKLLPPWDVIQFHIERFMKFIYPFIPVIDEHIFRLNLSKILIYPNVNEIAETMTGVKIRINSKSDTLRISLLLLVMRLSYLSVYLEIELTKQNASIPQQRILSYPIGPDVINLVQYSLNNTNFLRKSSIETFQLLLLYRFYQIKACEDGDGYMGSDGTTFSGLIASMAKSIGLNQQFDENIMIKSKINNKTTIINNTPTNSINTLKPEPNEIPDLNKFISPDLQMNLLMRGPIAFNQLWKKLWWSALSLDLNHSMIYGTATQFNHDHAKFKTGKLKFDPEFANSQNLEVERFTVDALNQFSDINFQLYEIIEMLHNCETKPAIFLIESKIDRILRLTETVFDNPNCSTYISPVLFVSVKVNNIKSKLEIYSCLLIIQYNLLLHCERLGIEEKKGYRSETLGMANERYNKLFPKIFSNWIFITESTILIWEKICGNSIVATDHNRNNFTTGKKAEFSSYILILAPVINILFSKLMSLLFYISIRLMLFHYNMNAKLIKREIAEQNTDKLNDLLKLYRYMILLFKTLVVIEAKLSKFWYSSLRSYTMFRKCFEWFEHGDKIIPESYTSTKNENYTKNNMNNINNDSNAQASITISQEFFLNMDNNIIRKINLDIERLIKTYNLEKIDSTFENIFPQTDIESPNPDNLRIGMPATTSKMMENVHSSDGDEELVTDNSSPEIKSIGNPDHDYFMEALEMDDWDDISKWFNQSPFLNSLEAESFKDEFDQFL